MTHLSLDHVWFHVPWKKHDVENTVRLKTKTWLPSSSSSASTGWNDRENICWGRQSCSKWFYWPPHLICMPSLGLTEQYHGQGQNHSNKRQRGNTTLPILTKTFLNQHHRSHHTAYSNLTVHPLPHPLLPQHPCFNVGNQQHTFVLSHTESSAYFFIFLNYWGRWGMRDKMGPGFPEGLLSLLLSSAIVNL